MVFKRRKRTLHEEVEQTLRSAYVDNYHTDTTRDLTEALTEAMLPIIAREKDASFLEGGRLALAQVRRAVNRLPWKS